MQLIILNDYGFVNGGAAQVAISSLTALAESGIDVTFISSVGPVDPAIDPNRVNVVNFGYHDLVSNPSRFEAALQGIWNCKSATRLSEILEGFDPSNTIIHLHGWTKSLSSSVIREVTMKHFKIVCTLHDYFAICPNGGLYNYNSKKSCKLVPMSWACFSTHCDVRSYKQKLWRFCRQLVQCKYGYMPKGVKNFITVSDYSQSLVKSWLPNDTEYIRINNPIDIPQGPPAKPAKNKNFTFVGRLSTEKGACVFAEAARLAKVHSVFVGIGGEASNIKLINQDAELCGWNDRAGVIQAIRSSRALVFPSLLHETQGIVVMEAAALGVPIIVSDNCAAKENIVDGKTGFLFKTGDAVDLASKLSLINANPQLADSLGKAAYDHYWAFPCTLENHVNDLMRCYKRINFENDKNGNC